MGFEKGIERLKKIDIKMIVYTGVGFTLFYFVLNKFVLGNKFSTNLTTIFLLASVLSFVLQSFTVKGKQEKLTMEQFKNERLEKRYGKENGDGNWRKDY